MHHETVCCPHCAIEIHHQCTIQSLEKLTRTSKYSFQTQLLETDIKHLTEEFNAIEHFLASMKSDIIHQKDHCLKEIRLVRRRLNNHLDNLEKNIVEEVSIEYENLKSLIDLTTKNTSPLKTNL